MQNFDIPWAHIAAPTWFEIEKIKPIKGKVSRSAAAKPKTAIHHIWETVIGRISKTHIDSPTYALQ